MPFRTIPGLDVQYGLISFDKNGRERIDDPEGGVFTRRLLDRIKTDPFCHYLSDALDKARIKHQFAPSEEGHVWRNWRNYLTEFAPQLFR